MYSIYKVGDTGAGRVRNDFLVFASKMQLTAGIYHEEDI